METLDSRDIGDHGAQMPQLAFVGIGGLRRGVVAPIEVVHRGKECLDGRSHCRLLQAAEDRLAVFDRVDGGRQCSKGRSCPWGVFVDAGEDLIEGQIVESVL